MDFDDIDQLVERMRAYGLAELELENKKGRIRLRMRETVQDAVPVTAPEPAPATAMGRVVVEAPLVGIFYRTSAPDATPFVSIGDAVAPGDVLCIIEAMKQMNDIPSVHAGTIEEVFVENGQPVEYGQRLFAISRR